MAVVVAAVAAIELTVATVAVVSSAVSVMCTVNVFCRRNNTGNYCWNCGKNWFWSVES